MPEQVLAGTRAVRSEGKHAVCLLLLPSPSAVQAQTFYLLDIDRDHRYEDDEKNTVILKK